MVWPLLILGGAIAGFMALKASRPKPQPVVVSERIWRVEVVSARSPQTDQGPLLRLNATVVQPQALSVRAARAARIAELPVREGERVTAGTLLLRLDDADLRPPLLRAQAARAEALASLASEQAAVTRDRALLQEEQRLLALQEAEVARAERLTSRELGSEQALDAARRLLSQQRQAVLNRRYQIDTAPARVAAAEARLQRAEADLAEAERDLARATVHAPYEGVVAQVRFSAGEDVTDNAELLTLLPLTGMELESTLPSARVPALRAEMRQGQVQAYVRLDTAPPQSLPSGPQPPVTAGVASPGWLRLDAPRPLGEGDARGLSIRVPIPGQSPLAVGELLELYLLRPAPTDALLVPVSALHGNDRLYLLTAAQGGDTSDADGAQTRLLGVDAEVLGPAAAGDDWLLVRPRTADSPLKAGALISATHLPNAIDGLRVDGVRVEGTADVDRPALIRPAASATP